MKQQLIKVISGEVDTLIEDEEKIELLNNINRQSKKVTSNNLVEVQQLSTMMEVSVHLVHKIQASQPSTPLTSMLGWKLSGRKKLISLGKNKSWSRLTSRRKYFYLIPPREVVSTQEVIYMFPFKI